VRAEDLRETWPDIPEWVDRRELGADVLRDLRGLSKPGAEFVADHLVAAGALADDEPELAWRHARAARSQGGRVAVVRETVGLVAYRAGEWAEAISELRAARRMGGGPGHLPVMADSERALGHPERAIELSRSVEATGLDPAAAAELTIVVAGARSDLGQHDAALVGLRSSAESVDADAPYAARLYYAYADLLARTGRRDDAVSWFIRAADVDADEETDATERLEEFLDEAEGEPNNSEPADVAGAAAEKAAAETAAAETAAAETAAAETAAAETAAAEPADAEAEDAPDTSGGDREVNLDAEPDSDR
jgi:tetratricopeptide (TPR) repeat protein